ncbi:MAG: enoyl-CoA hydratase/isomerase family protein [Deltaproteobacteria bacterium]|nr:enoyl-CoA hydratase/isomerase family protein [Deltaproteobacteria bacterium]
MAYEFAIYEKKGRIATITMNRPQVMNSIHPPATAELTAIWDDALADDNVWVVILTGAGDKAFSAGNDLKYTAEKGMPSGPRPKGGFGGITERLGLPEPRVGLAAAAGGVHRLPRQIPLKIAMGHILTGKHMTAQEALRYGIVNEVVPLKDLMPAAERWANEILECAPLSVRASKQCAMMGLGLPLDLALSRSYPALQQMMYSEDVKEGPKAFAEKRKPNWKGK